MTNINTHTTAEERSADIYKALFCQLYFPELQKFLSDFSISPTHKTETSTSLNMEFLLEAYDRSKRKESAKQQAKNECHWQLCDIRESDLMLAIEEFFHISNQKVFVGDREEPLSAERNQLLYYLFHNSQMEQIRLGDDLLRAILFYFGIQLDANKMEAGGMAKSFDSFCKQVNGRYGNFSQAILLHADLRNWQGHKHLPRFQGMELHLYHRYVLYAYIGLVYVCRRIWEDETCNKEELFKNGYLTCSTLEPFKMPKQPVHVKVSSPDVDIKKCDVRIGTKKTGNTIPYAEDILPNKNAEFDIEVRKYEPFILRITREGNDPSPFPKTLNYQSWFLTYDITLPKIIKSKYAESEEEPTGAVFLELLSAVESKDEALRMIVIQEMDKVKDLWIASVTSELEKDRQNYKNDLQKAMASMIDVVNSNQTDIEEKIKSIGYELSKRLNAYYLLLKELKNEIEKINGRTRKLEKFLSWSACLVLIILAWLPLLYHKFDRIDTFVWCSQYKWIYFAWLLPLLSVLAFAFFKSVNSWTGKIKQISILQWIGIVFTIVPLICITILICSAKTFVKDYDFSSADSNERMAEFMEKYLLETEDVSVISKLFSYYQLYGNNAEKANNLWIRISENAKKHPEEVIKAAEIFLATGDNVKLKNAIDICPQNYKDTSVVVMRLNGIMMAGGYGVDKKLEKGLELLDKASSKGDLEATYWLGHIASSIEFQEWKETESNRKIFMRYDIIIAINQLRKASALPKAAIELGNIYADLNMNDSAEYYYLKALSIDKNSLDAKYQIGRLYDKMGKDDNQYMSEAISRSYAPAMLYKAERDSDHISAIELYKLFDDSIKAKRYDKKYREDYRYIRPIVFEYVAAHNSGFFNGIDSAYNYLQKSRPNGHFNIEFVKGIKAMSSVDSTTKQNSWKFFRESADKGCLYAQMMCHYKDIMQILRSREKGEKLPLAEINTIDNKLDSLEDIGNEIPFSNVLISWISGLSEEGLDISERFAHKALIRGHLAGIIALSRNAFYYNNLINEILPTWDDEHPRQLSKPIQFNQITEKNLHATKGFWISTQLGLRYSPISANKMGFISLGADLSEIIDYAYEPQKEYPIESFHFWCDVAIANHDYVNECNFLKRIIRTFLQKGGQMNEEACRYLIEEPYTIKLIRAASWDMSKFPKPTYREFLTSSIKIYERLTGHYDHPNDSIPIYIKPTVRFASLPVLYGQYEDHDILYECNDWFSPYGSKMFDSRLKNFPKEQIIDFYGYDIFK